MTVVLKFLGKSKLHLGIRACGLLTLTEGKRERQ